MMLAAAHAPAQLSIPLAIAVGLWAVWFFQRQGRPGVPRSRRVIRRVSAVLILCALPAFVRGVSFVDHEAEGMLYVRTWMIAIGLLGLVLLTALADVVNNVRIHAHHQTREAIDAAEHLAQAMRTASPGERRDVADRKT
jgi:hypothetical protein